MHAFTSSTVIISTPWPSNRNAADCLSPRPLFFLDPTDEKTYGIADQFMLGDSLLVAPVLKKGAVARDIYLPCGQWTDYHSSQSYTGPKMLTAYPAPLEILPVFIRNN